MSRKLAILIDPEKCRTTDEVKRLTERLSDKRLYVDGVYHGPAMILVGGSTGTDSQWLVRQLKQTLSIPIVLFPGNAEQFTPEADYLLYLSLRAIFSLQVVETIGLGQQEMLTDMLRMDAEETLHDAVVDIGLRV